MQSLGGQLRVASGFSVRILGWDLVAAFQLADALGIDRMAVAVFLPAIERRAAAKMNEQLTQGSYEP